MPDLAHPSSFSLWLEDALTGWFLPVAAVVLVGGAWGLSVLGVLPEGFAGAAIALVMATALALLMVRPALSLAVDRPTRAATIGLAVAAFVLCLWPATGAVLPGHPIAEGDLAGRGDTLAVPAGHAGRVRLLVHAPLPPGGTPEVEFRLDGGAGAMSGHVERTASMGRAGRSRTTVLHERNETWVHGALASGTPVSLDYLSGPVAGALHVGVYGETLPPVALWILGALIVFGAAVVESRIGKGNVAALAGMAVAYGLLVSLNATPVTAVGTSLGGVLLGGLGGALAGGIFAALARLGPWVPAPVPPGSKGAARAPAKNGTAGAGASGRKQRGA